MRKLSAKDYWTADAGAAPTERQRQPSRNAHACGPAQRHDQDRGGICVYVPTLAAGSTGCSRARGSVNASPSRVVRPACGRVWTPRRNSSARERKTRVIPHQSAGAQNKLVEHAISPSIVHGSFVLTFASRHGSRETLARRCTCCLHTGACACCWLSRDEKACVVSDVSDRPGRQTRSCMDAVRAWGGGGS